MTPLEQSRIMIVGLVRNCASTLINDLDVLNRAFDQAKEISFFIVESDSTDRTVEILQKISNNRSNFNFISLGNLQDSYPKRTDRIARCRNKYLNYIENLDASQSVDYVVVVDLDGVNSKLDQQSVKSCWMRRDWDVCTANQHGPYYDIWALRHALWSPNDCWQQARMMRSLGLSRFKSIWSSVYARMITIPKNADWIEIDSAFGGLAIYRRRALLSCKYVGLNNLGQEVCEHVSFHQQMRSNGCGIFINPLLINGGIVEHAIPATNYGLIKFYFYCYVCDIAVYFQIEHFLKRVRSYFGCMKD